mmetsp:Transcript_98018/g.285908  ORF Transcript_98018/g.285908 Transcript_98018/m.285908 type:complete len:357 (-) Transcript_98018:201-1271(-)
MHAGDHIQLSMHKYLDSPRAEEARRGQGSAISASGSGPDTKFALPSVLRPIDELQLEFQCRQREHCFRSLKELTHDFRRRRAGGLRSLQELTRAFEQRKCCGISPRDSVQSLPEACVYDRTQLLSLFAAMAPLLKDSDKAAGGIVSVRVSPPTASTTAQAKEAIQFHDSSADAGIARSCWRSSLERISEEADQAQGPGGKAPPGHSEPPHDLEHCPSTAASGASSEDASEVASGDGDGEAEDGGWPEAGHPEPADAACREADCGGWTWGLRGAGGSGGLRYGCLQACSFANGQWSVYNVQAHPDYECFAPGCWDLPSSPSSEPALYTGNLWHVANDATRACAGGAHYAYAWRGRQQ